MDSTRPRVIKQIEHEDNNRLINRTICFQRVLTSYSDLLITRPVFSTG